MPLKKVLIGRDRKDKERWGTKGTIYLGKSLVGTGERAHLTNPVAMDIARPHVSLVVGKRGQGKSYSSCVIAEEILKLPDEIRSNLSVVMIDTMGIYWSLKNPNEAQHDLVKEWGLEPKDFDVTVYIPRGYRKQFTREGIPYDDSFSFQPSDLSVEDWALTFGISLRDEEGILLQRIHSKIEEENYGLDELIEAVRKGGQAESRAKQVLINLFESSKGWGIFSSLGNGTRIEDILKPGKVSIIDVSYLAELARGWSVRSLLVGLLARKIYSARIGARRKEEITTIRGKRKRKIPLTWLIIDEAHQFLPKEGKTAASDPLITLIRQGRQPGISCVLLSQRPGKLHDVAIAQADLIISHRLTARPDIEALRKIMQTYMLEDIRDQIKDLPREAGSAIVLDDNSERIFRIKMRPRQSWHAGATPTALKEARERF